MSNLQPPHYEPELSDVRTRAPTASALARRNANRIARRTESLRPIDYNRISRRRLATSLRTGNRLERPWHLSPPPLPPSTEPKEPPHKRRKMGSQGQYEIEQLPLDLRFCDGGQYENPRMYSRREFEPECALMDDSTVYCTKKSTCNMILKHADGHCFSLQKLVVRAPLAGYTCPVRAGMIFVTMDETDLLRRTDYTVQYLSKNDEDENELADDDNDHLPYGSDDLQDLDCDPPEAPEVEAEDYPYELRERLDAIDRISRRGAGSSAAESLATGSNSIPWGDIHQHFGLPRAPVELLKPDAVFGNRGKAAKFEINFEPPISGRFILAKFFATHRRDNVDIVHRCLRLVRNEAISREDFRMKMDELGN